MPLMKQVRDEDSIRPLSCKQGANSHKPFHHQIEKQPDQGSKRRSGKDINKGDETHATWRHTSTVVLADLGPQSKLIQNRSRTDLKVKLITIKINMQTTQWKPKAKRNMKLKTKPDSGSEEAAGAGERRWILKNF